MDAIAKNEIKNETNQRQYGLDFLKLICSFLVITIHITFPSEIGEYFVALARIAVPIFFMITGYFYQYTVEHKGHAKQILKIIKLIIVSNLLYFVFGITLASLKGSVYKYFSNIFTFEKFINFFFFNESPFASHLWYLNALFYTLLLMCVLEKIVEIKKLYFLIPILLVGDLILGKYSLLIFGTQFPYIIVRNFLFVGIPYFLLGHLIKNIPQNIMHNKSLLNLCAIIVFSLTTILERFVLVSTGYNAVRDHYISSTFLAIAVFLFAMKTNCNKNLYLKASMLGKCSASVIYITHPLIISVVGVAVNFIGSIVPAIKTVYSVIAPFFIFFLSIIFALFWNFVIKCLHRKSFSNY